jgi:hypothetical protein
LTELKLHDVQCDKDQSVTKFEIVIPQVLWIDLNEAALKPLVIEKDERRR